MKTLIFFLIATVLFLSCEKEIPKDNTYKDLKEAFLNPSQSAKPKVYWWCLNGNIDTVRAKQELIAMKEVGIGGFDLFEIGALDTVIPRGPAFLSDESIQSIKYVVEEAGKLGLSVGLNLASSWNAGGSWVKPEYGGKSLYVSKMKLTGNSTNQTSKLPFPEISFPKESLIRGTGKPMIPFTEDGKPEYFEEIAVLAIPADIPEKSLDTSRIINVTRFFDPENDQLSWEAPPGNWEIHRYVCSNSGQQVVIPSPLSAGLTIDHFDANAVEMHLNYIINKLKPELGDFRKTALKSFYLASYEARGFVWTTTLADEFKKLNGYDIFKLIPALFDPVIFPEETSKKLDVDFKKTLSELMINNLYKKAKEICNSHGLKINSEAGGPGYPLYNGPAEPLKAQGTLDIPRGEFWINHSRVYADKNGKDSIDVLRVVKETAAASNIYGKGIVEQEAFTSFQHWQEGPFDMKPFGDRAFCEGMNRVVFHGFSHNISNSGYPGFAYFAGTHFNDKRVWWPKVKPFVEYISRVSAVAQNTDFFADVLWYYGDKVPNSPTPKNAHFKVGPGYDYEVINTEILINNLSVKNGKLVLTNGAEFSMLALENEEEIHPLVLEKLNKLAKQGAIIVGEKPKKVAELKSYQISAIESENLINKLWSSVPDSTTIKRNKKGKIYSGITPLEMMQILNNPPDFNYSDKESNLLDFIHYSKNDVDFYFIRNTSNEWISRECGFRQESKIPEIWDPVSGEIIPVSIYRQEQKYIKLPITLAPDGSQFLVFKRSDSSPHYSKISGKNQHPPLLGFKNKGFCILEDGKFELTNQKESILINNNISTYTLNGPWDVSFAKDWGAPEKVIFPELKSWTESEDKGIKYFSGTGTYKKSFQYEMKSNPAKGQLIFLDLGDVSKVGEVWLNGQRLGITWSKPHRFNVTNILKSGENTLTVEVANVWSNRLKGDALTGQKYTNTNIFSTIVPAPGIEVGDQTRVPWAEVPLIESGLIGPVEIIIEELIH